MMTNYRVIKYKNWTIMGGTSVGWQILHPPYDEYYWKYMELKKEGKVSTWASTLDTLLDEIDNKFYKENDDDV